MSNQKKAATKAMIEWLSDQRELGRAPDKIKCVGEFDLYNLHYYIFKFKKSRFDRWLTGVSGGYQKDSQEHCGHVFSEMEPYDPHTAKGCCISMVELTRKYWMEQSAKKELKVLSETYEAPANNAVDLGLNHMDVTIPVSPREQITLSNNGLLPKRSKPKPSAPIGGFVLLSSPSWDVDRLKMLLRKEWGLFIPQLQDSVNVYNGSHNTFLWKESGMTVAIRLNPSPVPGGEAEENAANNFSWPEAVKVTKTHNAYILIAVLPGSRTAIEAGKLCVKLCDSCSRLDNALGVYTAGTVFQPEFYQKAAGSLKNGDLPILNWISFGLTPSAAGLSGYTYGMKDFGLEELEVIDSQAAPQELYEFLVNIADGIMSGGAALRTDEAFAFTADQKLSFTRSRGVYVDGYSLKISYRPACLH